VTVFFRVARPLAWPDARENGMTVTTARETPEGLSANGGNREHAPAILAAVEPGSS
jgi:hypothetical protein